jgi:hypothetical protein
MQIAVLSMLFLLCLCGHRAVAEINPIQGSKAANGVRKNAASSINGRVLALLNLLQE